MVDRSSNTDWVVHKFGGTSLADTESYRAVAEICANRSEARQCVVVSAMAGMTDALIALVRASAGRSGDQEATLEGLVARQRAVIEGLLSSDRARELGARLDSDVADLRDVLRAAWLMRSASQEAIDLVSGYGELWSAEVLARYLAQIDCDARSLDAREIIVIDHGELGPIVDWDDTQHRLDRALDPRFQGTLVVPGYVAIDGAGRATTLGRNGSDLSASIMASLLRASAVHIWTDVDGVLTADPNRVDEATVLSSLSYHEASELAYFGAKVIHPHTLAPAIKRGIPIHIRNTRRPQSAGTQISETGSTEFQIKGLSVIHEMALINLEGTGMIGVPGTAHRLFGALREAGISVVMISQASSEHSVCFVVRESDAQAAKTLAERAFTAELQQGQIQSISVTGGCSILAAVGDAMAGTPGVSAKFFGALGQAGVNVRAIAQGSSERNISAVVDSADSVRALRAAHAAFYLSPQTLSVGVVGSGNVGATLLDQLAGGLDRLHRDSNLDIRVRALADSRRMALDAGGFDPSEWRQRLKRGEALDLERLADHVQAEHLPHAVIIDCTASEAIAERYAHWLARGIHVITPNKHANTAPISDYRRLFDSARGNGARYLYETTVGAGLPVIQTLRDLRQTGDDIESIDGMFSGTLSYLFNVFDGSRPFSDIVREAKDSGYTEPDPREDLSGMDVARKLVILAREMGLELELSQLSVESLVPTELTGVTVSQFMERLPEHDQAMAERQRAAAAEGKVLRFIGRLDRDGSASVGLRSVPMTHPFANINLTDNIFRFVTRRYRENPLVVQGPGAGPAVTAGGVFSDLLRLASNLGAKL